MLARRKGNEKKREKSGRIGVRTTAGGSTSVYRTYLSFFLYCGRVIAPFTLWRSASRWPVIEASLEEHNLLCLQLDRGSIGGLYGEKKKHGRCV